MSGFVSTVRLRAKIDRSNFNRNATMRLFQELKIEEKEQKRENELKLSAKDKQNKILMQTVKKQIELIQVLKEQKV